MSFKVSYDTLNNLFFFPCVFEGEKYPSEERRPPTLCREIDISALNGDGVNQSRLLDDERRRENNGRRRRRRRRRLESLSLLLFFFFFESIVVVIVSIALSFSPGKKMSSTLLSKTTTPRATTRTHQR